MQGSPTYIMNVLLVTLLPGSVGLGLHLPGTPERIYLIFFNNYSHQAPVRVGLGLIDVSSGLGKLNTV